MRVGTRNLVLLGTGVVVFSLITTTISLALYHYSGDIYLDRSRPGFLPDEAEQEEAANGGGEDYKFAETGKLSAEAVGDFMTHYDEEIKILENYPKAFNPEQLSDAALGIGGGAGEENAEQ